MANSRATEKQPETRSIRNATVWQFVALLPLALLMRLWSRSVRVQLDDSLRRLLASPEPIVFVTWHNRLFLLADLYLRYRMARPRQVFALVSASRDGAWLAAFFRLLGISAERGSTSWRGAHALKTLAECLRKSDDVAITPDGPRGPCYSFKDGPAWLARQTNARVLLFTITFHRAVRLKSWDGFYLPLPFSSARLHFIDATETANAAPTANEAASQLRAQLLTLTQDRPNAPSR